eukprot:TRINITY_DN4586_c0_g1_i1.p1 TRINITY_DN4586_c0_g1~~TRINITY_DN4586_c0_g1_i1.p1  ORF type:complete len:1054 (+),score=258.69 TRINITY_DN4586_c0_g1_i1:87-3248(+)
MDSPPLSVSGSPEGADAQAQSVELSPDSGAKSSPNAADGALPAPPPAAPAGPLAAAPEATPADDAPPPGSPGPAPVSAARAYSAESSGDLLMATNASGSLLGRRQHSAEKTVKMDKFARLYLTQIRSAEQRRYSIDTEVRDPTGSPALAASCALPAGDVSPRGRHGVDATRSTTSPHRQNTGTWTRARRVLLSSSARRNSGSPKQGGSPTITSAGSTHKGSISSPSWQRGGKFLQFDSDSAVQAHTAFTLETAESASADFFPRELTDALLGISTRGLSAANLARMSTQKSFRQAIGGKRFDTAQMPQQHGDPAALSEREATGQLSSSGARPCAPEPSGRLPPPRPSPGNQPLSTSGSALRRASLYSLSTVASSLGAAQVTGEQDANGSEVARDKLVITFFVVRRTPQDLVSSPNNSTSSSKKRTQRPASRGWVEHAHPIPLDRIPRTQLVQHLLPDFVFPELDSAEEEEAAESGQSTRFSFALCTIEGVLLHCHVLRTDTGGVVRGFGFISPYPWFSLFDQALSIVADHWAAKLPEAVQSTVDELRAAPVEPGSVVETASGLRWRVPTILKRFPLADVDMGLLVQRLGTHRLGAVLRYVQEDKSVLIVGDDLREVSSAAHATAALATPLQWAYTLLPVLPACSRMLHVVEAPTPWIVGMHTSAWSRVDQRALSPCLLVLIATGETYEVSFGSYTLVEPSRISCSPRFGHLTLPGGRSMLNRIAKHPSDTSECLEAIVEWFAKVFAPCIVSVMHEDGGEELHAEVDEAEAGPSDHELTAFREAATETNKFYTWLRGRVQIPADHPDPFKDHAAAARQSAQPSSPTLLSQLAGLLRRPEQEPATPTAPPVEQLPGLPAVGARCLLQERDGLCCWCRVLTLSCQGGGPGMRESGADCPDKGAVKVRPTGSSRVHDVWLTPKAARCRLQPDPYGLPPKPITRGGAQRSAPLSDRLRAYVADSTGAASAVLPRAHRQRPPSLPAVGDPIALQPGDTGAASPRSTAGATLGRVQQVDGEYVLISTEDGDSSPRWHLWRDVQTRGCAPQLGCSAAGRGFS